RGELAGPGLARIEERLDRRFADWQSGRAPIDHRAQRRPMAFTPGGEAKDAAESVHAHGRRFCRTRTNLSTFVQRCSMRQLRHQTIFLFCSNLPWFRDELGNPLYRSPG